MKIKFKQIEAKMINSSSKRKKTIDHQMTALFGFYLLFVYLQWMFCSDKMITVNCVWCNNNETKQKKEEIEKEYYIQWS